MASSLLPMRPYQIEAVQAAESAIARGVRRPAEILPTGTGKTVIFAHLAKRWRERPWQRAGLRVLVLAHRTELIEQAVEKLQDVAPELSVGVVMGSRNETRADVVVASVATLRSEARCAMLLDIGLIIVDECHHAVAESYLRIMRWYGAWGDGMQARQDVPAVAVGFTATMERGDEKALGDVWQEVVYARSIAEMVHAGYLTRPRGVRVMVDNLNLANVRRSRGDFSEGDLGRAILDSDAPEVIAKAISEHSPDNPGLIFAPTVESARIIGTAVADAGFSVGTVWGEMEAGARRAVFDDFKAGRIQWISNCMIATEGTDLPRAVTAVIARPTKSGLLYKQMAGRVLRPYPGKTEALLLDVVGVTALHGLQSEMALFGEDAAAIKEKAARAERDDVDLDSEEILAPAALGLTEAEIYRPAGFVGDLVSEEVDLFASSASAWLRTRGGIWFLRAGDRLIVLLPGAVAGTWNVARCDAKRPGTGTWVATGVHELSYAMAWAEADVTPAEKMTASRERAWRKQPPSPEQKNYARRLGVILHPGMSKGEVSSLIEIEVATQRIDPYVYGYAGAAR